MSVEKPCFTPPLIKNSSTDKSRQKAVFKFTYDVFSVNEVKSHIDLMSRSVCLAAGLEN